MDDGDIEGNMLDEAYSKRFMHWMRTVSEGPPYVILVDPALEPWGFRSVGTHMTLGVIAFVDLKVFLAQKITKSTREN